MKWRSPAAKLDGGSIDWTSSLAVEEDAVGRDGRSLVSHELPSRFLCELGPTVALRRVGSGVLGGGCCNFCREVGEVVGDA